MKGHFEERVGERFGESLIERLGERFGESFWKKSGNMLRGYLGNRFSERSDKRISWRLCYRLDAWKYASRTNIVLKSFNYPSSKSKMLKECINLSQLLSPILSYKADKYKYKDDKLVKTKT